MSTRLDLLLVQRGLSESREKAQRLILAGAVRVGGHIQSKPGHAYPDDAIIEVAQAERFVGRGGEKMEAAFTHFSLDVKDRVCIDVGASTGGFSDCLLQHGASKIYAVDVGRHQLHEKLRTDPRVVVMDETNARVLIPENFPDRPTLAVVDVSFISLTKVLPAVTRVLATPAELVTLVKPQFEAGRDQVGKGGVVRDASVHRQVLDRVKDFGVEALGLQWMGECESPIRGPAGNVEFLVYWKRM